MAAARSLLEQARSCRFLRGLPNSSLRWVASAFSPRAVRKGQLIFIKGDSVSGLYLIITGAVRVFSTAEDGREVTYDVLGAGGVFGVISALDGGEQTTSAAAACDSALLFMSRGDFLATVNTDDLARLALLAAVADRFRTLTALFEEQRLDTIETRLARTLLRVEEAHGTGDRVMAMTQLQLGSMAGLSRERASRLLTKWAASGIINVRRSKVTILSHKELHLLAARGHLH
jgi:CRP/FNR family cyclic AMP-dependent transcriptional regulator